MSIYSINESGTKNFKSRYTKSISNTMRYDCTFHELVPVLKRFCLPGDVWRISGDALIRFLPMKSPSMTRYYMVVRYFFVPLRQVEENTELIITGSVDGKLYNGELPVFDNFLDNATDGKVVTKYSFWDYMNVQCGDYSVFSNDDFLPAAYWRKAYDKIWWDYYRDENYDTFVTSPDFETYSVNHLKNLNDTLNKSRLKKDYFTSALPWQLKGDIPTLDVTGLAQFTPNFQFGDIESGSSTGVDYSSNDLISFSTSGINGYANFNGNVDGHPFTSGNGSSTQATREAQVEQFTENFGNILNQSQQAQITGLGFNAAEFRFMMQQTRIFERLARCGSRYTEYLYSNFGIAPADETLQRPKYLGGWKIPIVTSEVLQTAQDSTNPVGTMRGHGISRGGNKIKDFHCKEFGVLFGLAEVRPYVEYTTGIPRQLTYKKRFSFFNPSFQHLSEQETRNGELFVNFTPDSDGHYDNDITLGFQAYANELRSSQDEVVGDMRDSLSYWGSALHFTTRPNVKGLLSAGSHLSSFNAPFVNTSSSARNIIVNFANILDVYRPMVRFSTPGLVDHF